MPDTTDTEKEEYPVADELGRTGPANGTDAASEKTKKPEKEPGLPGAVLFDVFQTLMECFLAAVLVFNCLFRFNRVDGASMNNTLQDGQLLLVWSAGYEPRAGDIVVFNKKSTDYYDHSSLIKRVIATGGQRVDIDYSTGTVYVDGVALDEPYIAEPMYAPADPREQGTHWDVPEGSVFVMGDNRNNSSDGRHDALGPIDTEYILGRALISFWPPDRIGLLL